MLPLPKQDQAAELRRLIMASRTTFASAATIAVAGATVHSGASRFAKILNSAGDALANDELVRIELCPPSDAATTSTVFRSASQRIVVVTPDEVDIMGAFSLLKSAVASGLLDESLWVVAHRCVGLADQQMVLGTLRVVCRKHLGHELKHLIAVEDSVSRGNAITPAELLSQMHADRRHSRLAAHDSEQL